MWGQIRSILKLKHHIHFTLLHHMYIHNNNSNILQNFWFSIKFGLYWRGRKLKYIYRFLQVLIGWLFPLKYLHIVLIARLVKDSDRLGTIHERCLPRGVGRWGSPKGDVRQRGVDTLIVAKETSFFNTPISYFQKEHSYFHLAVFLQDCFEGFICNPKITYMS